MKPSLLVLAATALTAAADCPNACSGHGMCRENDACVCDPNYTGADCSQRVCPFDLAFVDVPRGDLNHNGQVDMGSASKPTLGYTKVQWSNVAEYEAFPTDPAVYAAAEGEAHFYAECSGKGECDRDSGECKCYSGYTGAACQRTACPKDCSGHGVCRTMKEIAAGSLNKREVMSFAGHKYFSGVRDAFTYNLWDADKHQACVCDSGFGGADCSQRMCPRGDDPLTTDPHRWCGAAKCSWEQQAFTLSSTDLTTYKIGYTDALNATQYTYATVKTSGGAVMGYVEDSKKSTLLPGPTTVAGQIMDALRSMAGGLLQRVEVYPMADSTTSTYPATGIDTRTFVVTFVGVPGDQAMLSVVPVNGPGALDVNPYSASAAEKTVEEVTRGNFEDVECSGRGLCDSSMGLCKCFAGFSGAACEFQNALAM